MIRISKLTDYGVVLMADLARRGTGELHAVADLSSNTGLPRPTVSKVVKLLAKDGLLSSVRGAHGGYRLSRDPETISVAQIVTAMQGSIALVDCLDDSNPCSHEATCALKGPWERINRVLHAALEELSLANIAGSPGSLRVGGGDSRVAGEQSEAIQQSASGAKGGDR